MGRNMTLRNGIWHFQKRVPTDLVKSYGMTHIRKSLDTTDERVAAGRARRLSVRVDETFEKKRIELGLHKKDQFSDVEALLRPRRGSKLDNHVKQFMSQPHIKELGDKSQVNYNQVLRYFAEHFENRSIERITIKDCGEFKQLLMKIPARRSNNEAALPFSDITKLIDKDQNRPPVTAKRVQTLIGCVRMFLDWCVETGYVEANPMTQIKVSIPKSEKNSDSRKPWGLWELNQWFNCPIYKGSRNSNRRMTPGSHIIMDVVYWLPIVGLYTGARVEELAMLQKRDIKKDPETGIWFFNITTLDEEGNAIVDRSLKTEAAIRKVPVHSRLFELGFFHWANDHGMPNIFKIDGTNAAGKWSGNFVKTFGRYKRGSGVLDSGMVFHSFRHMVIHQLKTNKEVDKYELKQLVGHERGDDTTEGYGGDYPLERMKELVELITYSVKLDHIHDHVKASV